MFPDGRSGFDGERERVCLVQEDRESVPILQETTEKRDVPNCESSENAYVAAAHNASIFENAKIITLLKYKKD